MRPELITVAEQHRARGRTSGSATPTAAATSARSSRSSARSSGYDAWITGIRREQSPTRADAPKVEWSERYGVWKIQPLVDWDAKRVEAYIHGQRDPVQPAARRGYPSIGCIPCTRPWRPGEDERAGRWAGSDKLECGIHGDGRPGKGEIRG